MLRTEAFLDIAPNKIQKHRSRGRRRYVGKRDQLKLGESARSCLYLYLRRAELKVLASLASTVSVLALSLGAGRARFRCRSWVCVAGCLRKHGESEIPKQARPSSERDRGCEQWTKSWQNHSRRQHSLARQSTLRMTGQHALGDLRKSLGTQENALRWPSTESSWLSPSSLSSRYRVTEL